MTESDNPLLPLPYGLASTTAGALPLSTVFFTKARKAAVPSVAESGYAEHHRREQAGHFLNSQSSPAASAPMFGAIQGQSYPKC
jgi:hypothetical protein